MFNNWFIEAIDYYQSMREKYGLRYGQCLYNYLTRSHIVLANRIVDTDLDPYYDDTKVGGFLEFVKAELGN